MYYIRITGLNAQSYKIGNLEFSLLKFADNFKIR